MYLQLQQVCLVVDVGTCRRVPRLAHAPVQAFLSLHRYKSYCKCIRPTCASLQCYICLSDVCSIAIVSLLLDKGAVASRGSRGNKECNQQHITHSFFQLRILYMEEDYFFAGKLPGLQYMAVLPRYIGLLSLLIVSAHDAKLDLQQHNSPSHAVAQLGAKCSGHGGRGSNISLFPQLKQNHMLSDQTWMAVST